MMMADILALRKIFKKTVRGSVAPIVSSIFFLFGAIVFYADLSSAQDSHHSADSKIDAVLVLDASGSMRLTDPARLRDEGATVFLDSLDNNDRVALVEFAEGAKELLPLTDLGVKEVIKGALPRVGDSGEFTDLLAGLAKAREILSKTGRPDAHKMVVLLSDGKMDPRPEIATPELQLAKLFSDELPSYKGQGIVIHTLAFSDLADQKLLADIATLTGGVSTFTPTAEGLGTAFAGLSKAIRDGQEEISKTPTIVGKVARSFLLDEGIEEATFYVNRGASTGINITPPGGQKFDVANAPPEVKWYRGDDFDVVTVSQPTAGEWNVSGVESKDNFVTVLTNLKLIVEWSAERVTVDEPVSIEARFLESRKPIILPQLASTLTYSFQIIPTDRISEPILKGTLHDDGESGDHEGNDGVFSTEIILREPGSYKLILNARGKTLTREQQSNFVVHPRLLTLSLYEGRDLGAKDGDSHGHKDSSKSDHKGPSDNGKHQEFFRIVLDEAAAAVRERSIKLRATSSADVTYNIPIPTAKKDQTEFLVPTSVIPTSGRFDIYAILGGSLKGRTINTQSNLLKYISSNKPVGAEVDINNLVIPQTVQDEPKPKSGSASGLVILTLITVAIAVYAIRSLKALLAGIVISDESYSAPDAAIAMVGKIKERAAETNLNLADPALSPEAIDKILATPEDSEAIEAEENVPEESSSNDEEPVEDAITESSGESDLQASGADLPIAPPTPPDPTAQEAAPAKDGEMPEPPIPAGPAPDPAEKVESEIDEETKKLLEQLGDTVSSEKGS